jgi:hypothetical protein
MKTKLSMMALAALLFVAIGCKGNRSATASTTPAANVPASTSVSSAATPEQLGALGAEIKKHPNDAHKLIKDHGLSEESFAAAVRKVSEDPAAAKRYAAAYKQASS